MSRRPMKQPAVPARAGRRRWARALAALGIGSVLGLVGGECALRWLLFGDSALARRLGAGLRHPEFFADGDSEDDHWKLELRFRGPLPQGTVAAPDPLLGWTADNLSGPARIHVRSSLVGSRRPVLLYGDSFAACVTDEAICFGGLLEESELGRTHALINYGMGGYGTDQIYLLARETIGQWDGQDPVAIGTLLVDSDFERAWLGYRSGPKPRLTVVDGELRGPEPFPLDVRRYFEERPIQIRSYLWRLFVVRQQFLPEDWGKALRGDVRQIEGKRELNRAILRAFVHLLKAHSSRAALILFHGRASLLNPDGYRWEEDLAREACAAEGVPLYSSRPYLLAAVGGSTADLDPLFFPDGEPGGGHYTELGNRATFEAVRQAIEGRTQGEDISGIPQMLREHPEIATASSRIWGWPAQILERTGLKGLSLVRSKGAQGAFNDELVALRVLPESPCVVELALGGRAKRLSARVESKRCSNDAPAEASVRLRFRVDGQSALERSIAAGKGQEPLELDLADAQTLRIEVQDASAAVWVMLHELVLE